MDTLYFSVCFVALFAFSLGAAPPLVVTFENDTKVDVVPGAKDILFLCHLNRDPMYVINNKIDMVRVNPVTGEETILSSIAEHKEGEPEFYSVKVESHPEADDSIILRFIIRTVRLQDDGIYKCHVHTGGKGGSDEEGSAEREVVVHRPFSSLKLKLGDFDALEDSPASPLDIDHGNYKVACIAEGSNPATEDIQMSFHGSLMDHSAAVSTQMEGSERKFSTIIEGNLDVVVDMSNQEIVCQAMDSTGQSKTVKLKINVNTYDPEVTCNKTEAHLGQANPILLCFVNYTGQEIAGYSFQLGDSGEIVKDGAKNDKNIVVTSSEIEPGMSEVKLDLHKAEEEYFGKNYYLIVDLVGGHSMRTTVLLHKTEAPEPVPGSTDSNKINSNGPENNAVRLSPAFLLYVLMCVAALWSRH